MAFDQNSVETITVDSYGTLVDPASIQQTLTDYVEDPATIANLWFSRSLLNKLVSNFIGIYKPFDVLSKDGLNYALKYHNIQLSQSEKEEILTAYNNLAVFEGVEEGIKRITEKGYEVYVISNGTPKMLETLTKHAGVADVVSDTISTDEVETYKPDSKFYRHAAARTGTPINQVLHVSGPFFDVLGAMAAGMQGGWINYKDQPRDTFAGEPSLEIASFNELADLLPAQDD